MKNSIYVRKITILAVCVIVLIIWAILMEAVFHAGSNIKAFFSKTEVVKDSTKLRIGQEETQRWADSVLAPVKQKLNRRDSVDSLYHLKLNNKIKQLQTENKLLLERLRSGDTLSMNWSSLPPLISQDIPITENMFRKSVEVGDTIYYRGLPRVITNPEDFYFWFAHPDKFSWHLDDFSRLNIEY